MMVNEHIYHRRDARILSISLGNALKITKSFAQGTTEINSDEVIFQSSKSLLHHNGKLWIKKMLVTSIWSWGVTMEWKY